MTIGRFGVLLACVLVSVLGLVSAACHVGASPAVPHEPASRYHDLLSGQEQ